MAEILLQQFKVPAFHITNTGVLNSCVLSQPCLYAELMRGYTRFAAGKRSALVIDIGHETASVTPVVDGFVLRKGDLLLITLCTKVNKFGFR